MNKKKNYDLFYLPMSNTNHFLKNKYNTIYFKLIYYIFFYLKNKYLYKI